MFINLYFVLTISYLQIKSYNVLNYNNCSTDWSLTLRCILYFAFLTFKVVKFEKRNYFHRLECKYPEGGPINRLSPVTLLCFFSISTSASEVVISFKSNLRFVRCVLPVWLYCP
jgi:hypothetical protein